MHFMRDKFGKMFDLSTCICSFKCIHIVVAAFHPDDRPGRRRADRTIGHDLMPTI